MRSTASEVYDPSSVYTSVEACLSCRPVTPSPTVRVLSLNTRCPSPFAKTRASIVASGSVSTRALR